MPANVATRSRAGTASLSRAGKVIAFIEHYCRVPEGQHVGRPLELMPFQAEFIRAIYDNPAGTSRAYLSIARKNGKSALIAALALAHVVGPEAKQNSQIISGAQSRDQASLVFKLAEKMVALNPDLKRIVKTVPSLKTLVGLPMNVEYRAISAEASTAHGLSPVLAILDEVGQVQGPYDRFVEALETAQGAHANPLLVAISTQASNSGDLFSLWLDDAHQSGDPRIVSRVHAAPDNCDLMDRAAWQAANPALGVFRSETDIADYAERAARLPTAENTFRWLYLNQRVEATAPFISPAEWCKWAAPARSLAGVPVYAGLDLSAVKDLTALVLVGQVEGVWQVHPTFWLPAEGLAERSRQDRVPYDVWHREGKLATCPGRSIDYDFVAAHLWRAFAELDVHKVAFDAWNFKFLRPRLLEAGFSEMQLAENFTEFGQGYKSMSPALAVLEKAILAGRLAHGGHPVLNMCAENAVVVRDPAENRKLAKDKSTGRIDGMVALAMAMSVAGAAPAAVEVEYLF